MNKIRVRIKTLTRFNGMTVDEYTDELKKRTGLTKPWKDLTIDEADELIREIQLDEAFCYNHQ
jgi:hypothetical protein